MNRRGPGSAGTSAVQPPFATLVQAAELVLEKARAIEAVDATPAVEARAWQAAFAEARAVVNARPADSAVLAALAMRVLGEDGDIFARQSPWAAVVARTLAAAVADLTAQGSRGTATALSSLLVSMGGEDSLPALLPYYVCSEALLRCRLAAGTIDEARAFWRVAIDQARLAAGPVLILCAGISGSGKSFVANGVGGALGAAVFSSDTTRKQLAGLPLTERTPAHLNEDVYSPALTERVFRTLHESAERELRAGRAVVLDATYLTPRRRALPVYLARQFDVPVLLLWCRVAESVAAERLQARAAQPWTVSDADRRIRSLQRASAWERPRDGENGAAAINVDTGTDPSILFSGLLKRIERILKRG
jgi:predicted kinase